MSAHVNHWKHDGCFIATPSQLIRCAWGMRNSKHESGLMLASDDATIMDMDASDVFPAGSHRRNDSLPIPQIEETCAYRWRQS